MQGKRLITPKARAPRRISIVLCIKWNLTNLGQGGTEDPEGNDEGGLHVWKIYFGNLDPVLPGAVASSVPMRRWVRWAQNPRHVQVGVLTGVCGYFPEPGRKQPVADDDPKVSPRIQTPNHSSPATTTSFLAHFGFSRRSERRQGSRVSLGGEMNLAGGVQIRKSTLAACIVSGFTTARTITKTRLDWASGKMQQGRV